MSFANFEEIFLICCDWEFVSVRHEMIKLKKNEVTKGLDLISLKTDSRWGSGLEEILNDPENSKEKVLI